MPKRKAGERITGQPANKKKTDENKAQPKTSRSCDQCKREKQCCTGSHCYNCVQGELECTRVGSSPVCKECAEGALSCSGVFGKCETCARKNRVCTYQYAVDRSEGFATKPGPAHIFGAVLQVRPDLEPMILEALYQEMPGTGLSVLSFLAKRSQEDQMALNKRWKQGKVQMLVDQVCERSTMSAYSEAPAGPAARPAATLSTTGVPALPVHPGGLVQPGHGAANPLYGLAQGLPGALPGDVHHEYQNYGLNTLYQGHPSGMTTSYHGTNANVYTGLSYTDPGTGTLIAHSSGPLANANLPQYPTTGQGNLAAVQMGNLWDQSAEQDNSARALYGDPGASRRDLNDGFVRTIPIRTQTPLNIPLGESSGGEPRITEAPHKSPPKKLTFDCLQKTVVGDPSTPSENIDAGHHDTSHHDTSHHYTSHQDASHYDASHHDASHHDASHHDTNHHGTGHQDISHHDTSNHDSSNHEDSHPDASRHDASHHDASHPDNNHPDDSPHDASHHDTGHHDTDHHDTSHPNTSQPDTNPGDPAEAAADTTLRVYPNHEGTNLTISFDFQPIEEFMRDLGLEYESD
ncbi:uncharacterized protein GGS22DRAFT_199152 [Annulohypoxylon maeteangense]|uniref:uncharacterized protein n=1 Tax=Annulohypoxylon maeteangense TaxID=1927788 RepID=UPI0020080012|nr:uncharacterized protein GGS22DRAFT_199152 [Annulohypoxylon maeteangense]KAI0886794.1 hypothetical protein GGS22DRAFT_199152 [Annulohypoxylon maeteangense]